MKIEHTASLFSSVKLPPADQAAVYLVFHFFRLGSQHLHLDAGGKEGWAFDDFDAAAVRTDNVIHHYVYAVQKNKVAFGAQFFCAIYPDYFSYLLIRLFGGSKL
jgi:hypothetical protein